MGGKSRKSGGVSKKLITRLKSGAYSKALILGTSSSQAGKDKDHEEEDNELESLFNFDEEDEDDS